MTNQQEICKIVIFVDFIAIMISLLGLWIAIGSRKK